MRAGIPPRVTSKKTTGFSSAVSAMAVAVQMQSAALFRDVVMSVAGSDDAGPVQRGRGRVV